MGKITLGIVLLICAEPLFAQNKGYIQISSSDAIHYIVTDPIGRRTGRDPRGASEPELGEKISEIPEANYSFMSVGDIPAGDEDVEEDVEEDYTHQFTSTFASPQEEGVYSIETIGIRTDIFNIYIHITNHRNERSIFRSEGVSAPNHVTEYVLVISSDPDVPSELRKTPTIQAAVREIEIMFELGWISPAGIYRSLQAKLENARRLQEQGDFQPARDMLQAFLNELEAIRNEHLSEEAYALLKYNADYLIEHLETR